MAIIKSGVLRGGNDQHSDARSYAMLQMKQCGLDIVLRYLYPLLLDIGNMGDVVAVDVPIHSRQALSSTRRPSEKTCKRLAHEIWCCRPSCA